MNFQFCLKEICQRRGSEIKVQIFEYLSIEILRFKCELNEENY